jgi:protein-S-isoprenylcysteine O-methyltransferase Ste14
MTETATANPVDAPGVIARPPNLVFATVLLGLALEWLRPTHLPGGRLRSALGIALVAGGVALMAAAMRQFRAAGTHVETWRPTETIVTHGLYARTRNPIYLAMIAIYTGIALGVDSAWLLGLVVPLALVLRYGVIAREERYLERKFGEPYRAYCAAVRRWL